MKSLLKRILAVAGAPVDIVFAGLVAPSALVLLAYRKTGSVRLPRTTWLLRKIGVFPIKKHYYEPLFDTSQLSKPLSEVRFLPGIDLAQENQLAFLQTLHFASELIEMELTRKSDDATVFSMDNGSFDSGDADYLYQFIRAVKPRKVLEIGSGHSTKIAAAAMKRNSRETQVAYSHTCIEPYEMPWLEKLAGINVIRKRLEDCQIDWAQELASGDLLFIDSSHMIRPQGDVLMEYLEVLPLLSSGVFVHIHDIFTPRDYPHQWVVDEVKFWNEQYLLEALLSDTARYEIVGALNYLKHGNYDQLKAVCPYLEPTREPGSIYLRIH